jgi:hypothetical protein
MIDYAAFEAAMIRAVEEWPYSTEAALTASTMNHQAWMGHAGCAINHNAPEDLTRLAWRTLSQAQQDAANEAADRAIDYWATRYAEKKARDGRADRGARKNRLDLRHLQQNLPFV